MQVKHFLVFGQAVTKGISNISCGPTLTVPVKDEDIVENSFLFGCNDPLYYPHFLLARGLDLFVFGCNSPICYPSYF